MSSTPFTSVNICSNVLFLKLLFNCLRNNVCRVRKADGTSVTGRLGSTNVSHPATSRCTVLVECAALCYQAAATNTVRRRAQATASAPPACAMLTVDGALLMEQTLPDRYKILGQCEPKKSTNNYIKE